MAAPSFRVTFAGLPFRMADQRVNDEIDRMFPLDGIVPYGATSPDWYRQGHFPSLLPFVDRQVVRINELYWPRDARRWSLFRGLMTRQDAETVLAIPGANPNSFVMTDEVGGTISTQLYRLGAQPVLGVDGVTDLYLMTLVDKRYLDAIYNIHRSYSFISPANTWERVIESAEYQIGNTAVPIVPVVDAVYLTPSTDSIFADRPLAVYGSYGYEWGKSPGPVLDLALANIGQFYAKTFGGVSSFVKHSDACQTVIDEMATYAGSLTAGGLVAPRAIGGTVVADREIPGYVYTGFTSFYESSRSAAMGDYLANWPRRGRTIAPVPPSATAFFPLHADLQGAPYDTMGAQADVCWLWDMAHNDNAGTYTATLQALANQLAKDYWDQLRVRVDAVYDNIVPFSPLSGCDIIFRWHRNNISTRVKSQNPGSITKYFQHQTATLEFEPWPNCFDSYSVRFEQLTQGDTALTAGGGDTGWKVPFCQSGNSTAPTVNDDSSRHFSVGSRWIRNSGFPQEEYVCIGANVGAATWLKTA